MQTETIFPVTDDTTLADINLDTYKFGVFNLQRIIPQEKTPIAGFYKDSWIKVMFCVQNILLVDKHQRIEEGLEINNSFLATIKEEWYEDYKNFLRYTIAEALTELKIVINTVYPMQMLRDFATFINHKKHAWYNTKLSEREFWASPVVRYDTSYGADRFHAGFSKTISESLFTHLVKKHLEITSRDGITKISILDIMSGQTCIWIKDFLYLVVAGHSNHLSESKELHITIQSLEFHEDIIQSHAVHVDEVVKEIQRYVTETNIGYRIIVDVAIGVSVNINDVNLLTSMSVFYERAFDVAIIAHGAKYISEQTEVFNILSQYIKHDGILLQVDGVFSGDIQYMKNSGLATLSIVEELYRKNIFKNIKPSFFTSKGLLMSKEVENLFIDMTRLIIQHKLPQVPRTSQFDGHEYFVFSFEVA